VTAQLVAFRVVLSSTELVSVFSDFGDVFKETVFFSGVKDLLPTTGVQVRT
jgi:hypothetical protein